MYRNAIYYRFRSEMQKESVSFEGPEITAAELRNEIKTKKFGAAPEKFELVLRDSTTNREFGDMEYIEANTIVVVQRLPSYKIIPGGVYTQPNDDHEEALAKSGGKEATAPQTPEEKADQLLLRNNVSSGHRLYPFLKGSRFFIIKSANERNIEVSQRNGEWATTTFNQGKLDSAFKSCTNVIFLFSVNKSQHFQGMAKMISGLTSKVSREWMNEGVKLGYSFKIKWLVNSKLPSAKVSHLKNPYTNEPIKKARDCTEIPADIGVVIAVQIDEHRIPGGIDFPTEFQSIPNMRVENLTAPEKNSFFKSGKGGEEKIDTFSLFDDIAASGNSIPAREAVQAPEEEKKSQESSEPEDPKNPDKDDSQNLNNNKLPSSQLLSSNKPGVLSGEQDRSQSQTSARRRRRRGKKRRNNFRMRNGSPERYRSRSRSRSRSYSSSRSRDWRKDRRHEDSHHYFSHRSKH